MTRIDSAVRIAEIVRRQIDGLRDVPARASAQSSASPNATAGQALSTAKHLQATIARRVQAIGEHDPDRRRKAFQVFLESVLLSELGESLINDSGFYQLVEQVQRQMESDAELAKAMDKAADLLLDARRR